jgi:hypothetical protein
MTLIPAHVQPCQRHMCSVQDTLRRCYSAAMQPEQKIIANWIERTARAKGWTLGEWAKRAGLGAETTVTRAVKDDYTSVTTVKTLEALAKAAGEPSLLEFLQGERPAAGQSAPSEETLAALLAVVLPLAPKGRQSAQSLRVVAAALAHGLELLGDQSASSDNENALGVAARGAVARLRDLTRQ